MSVPDPERERVLALHTAARRSLIERWEEWAAKHAQVAREARSGGRPPAAGAYTLAELDAFPRWQVLEAILAAVEGLRPADLASVATARDMLRLAARHASSGLVRANRDRPAALRAMHDERERFGAEIERLAASPLTDVAPLPARRTLAPAEHDAFLERLAERWGVGSDDPGWPWDEDGRLPADVAAFSRLTLTEGEELEGLLEAVARVAQGAPLLTAPELSDFAAEIELDWLAPLSPGATGPPDGAWLLLADADGMIVVAGTLLEELLEQRPALADLQLPPP